MVVFVVLVEVSILGGRVAFGDVMLFLGVHTNHAGLPRIIHCCLGSQITLVFTCCFGASDQWGVLTF